MRRSLSASLGSWCISLVHNPRREVQNGVGGASRSVVFSPDEALASEAALLFPAYLASFIGVAAACLALAHFITFGVFSGYLAVLLLGAGITGYGSKCSARLTRKWFKLGRWGVGISLIFLAVSSRGSNLVSADSDIGTNSSVAIFIGLITILSFLMIGVKSGGRIISPCAPLVPCLSLFGLLCLISVDSVVQICFLIFLFSSLYLLSYDRYLRRVAPEISLGIVGATATAAWPNRAKVHRWSMQSLAVAGVWLFSFFGGGLLLYWPIQTFLPGLVSQPLSRMRAAANNFKFNYSGSASVMEVTGGNYALSERDVMRITVKEGRPSGLWRGKVYEYYDRSRWEENSPHFESLDGWSEYRNRLKKNKAKPNIIPSSRKLDSLSAWSVTKKLSPQKGRVRSVLEVIESLDSRVTSFYASGEFSNWLERPDMATSQSELGDLKTPYLVRSFFVEPRWAALMQTSGYEKQLKNGRIPLVLRESLQLPRDEEARRTISAIAHQIEISQRDLPDTPHRKVRSVGSFLLENCFYSLNSPKVPPTKDAVVFFLTESHTGACDMFASSMVLLLREMNVPARLVTGYIQSDSYTSDVDGLHSQTYMVKERDAHAWVEYYVPEYGWLSYDPTQGSRIADNTLPNQISKLLNVPGVSVSPLLLFMPVVGLSILLLGLRANPTRSERRSSPNSEQLDLQRLIFDSYNKARGSLQKRVAFEKHLTPSEYEARVCRSLIPSEAKQEFAALTHLFLIAKYGQTPDVSSQSVQACLKRLRLALKRSKR